MFWILQRLFWKTTLKQNKTIISIGFPLIFHWFSTCFCLEFLEIDFIAGFRRYDEAVDLIDEASSLVWRPRWSVGGRSVAGALGQDGFGDFGHMFL